MTEFIKGKNDQNHINKIGQETDVQVSALARRLVWRFS